MWEPDLSKNNALASRKYFIPARSLAMRNNALKTSMEQFLRKIRMIGKPEK